MSGPDRGGRRARFGRVRPDTAPDTVDRALAIEVPIAIEYNGIGYAVMMATPVDLENFATGFSLSERLVMRCDEIVDIDAIEQPDGWVLRIALSPDCVAPVIERARARVSESSCGLCGLESLEQVMRPLPAITTRPTVRPAALFAALDALPAHQPMNAATGAVHAAAFCTNDGAIHMVREDVGRHNALDKLIGALASDGIDPARGFVLLTARCSYELVEKTILAACPLLVTISAPTTLAAARARAHGLTLIALARRDAMLVVSDPWDLFQFDL